MIEVLDLERLSAGSSDHLTAHHKKECLHYFADHDETQHKLEILIHGFTGDVCKSSHTELFISGSHKHPEFFKLLAKYWTHPTHITGSSSTWYVKLQIRDLNDIVKDIKQEKSLKSISQHIKLHLSEQYIKDLPNEFFGVYLPVKQASISFIHPQTLRCQMNTTSDTIRWKALYSCVCFPEKYKLSEKDIKKFSGYSSFPRPQAARKFEKSQVKPVDIWPWKIKTSTEYDDGLVAQIQKSMNQHGLVTIPLAYNFVHQYVAQFELYMKQIMKCPYDQDLFNINTIRDSEEKEKIYHYRNIEQSFSRHIPKGHGRTHYGHYCPAMKQLFLNIMPVVNHAIKAVYPKDKECYITTSELIVQY